MGNIDDFKNVDTYQEIILQEDKAMDFLSLVPNHIVEFLVLGRVNVNGKIFHVDNNNINIGLFNNIGISDFRPLIFKSLRNNLEIDNYIKTHTVVVKHKNEKFNINFNMVIFKFNMIPGTEKVLCNVFDIKGGSDKIHLVEDKIIKGDKFYKSFIIDYPKE